MIDTTPLAVWPEHVAAVLLQLRPAAPAPCPTCTTEAAPAPLAVRNELPCSQLLSIVRRSEPLSACWVAHEFGPRGEIELERLESAGLAKRWTDRTRRGDGRTFVGTVNQRGATEPDEGQAPTRVDPRTALAYLRNRRSLSGKQLARLLDAALADLAPVIDSLVAAGLIEKRGRGQLQAPAADAAWLDEHNAGPSARHPVKR